MKKLTALAAITALAGSAYAQLSPVPNPSGPNDGVWVSPIAGVNNNATYWSNPAGLLAYQFSSDINLNTPKPGTPDNKLGLFWGATPNADVLSMMSQINADGGSIRVIFLGESAGWWNDFGYTYSGLPADLANSFSLWNNIQSVAPDTNIVFGDNATISLAKGEASTFDFWLNGANAGNWPNPAPGAPGGVYTAFNPANGESAVNVSWTQSYISVRSYVDGTLANDYWNKTYLVGFEDIRGGGDADYNDFMFAVQFFKSDGTPFTPVPEPSTYGLMGAAALLAFVARRRFSKK
jgi:hypothetical protein